MLWVCSVGNMALVKKDAHTKMLRPPEKETFYSNHRAFKAMRRQDGGAWHHVNKPV